ASCLARENIGQPERPVLSTITARRTAPEEDLRELLCRQVTSPVRFIEALTAAAAEVDLFIEVGPGNVLQGLTRDCVATPVISLDAGGNSIKSLLEAVAAVFVSGASVNHGALFADRFTRPFNSDWQPKFFTNPCESAPVSDNGSAWTPRPTKTTEVGRSVHAEPSSVVETIRRLVATRAELPLTAVRDDSRFLTDLHLNSITVGQLVAEAARRLNLPPLIGLTDFANATIAKVGAAFEELARNGSKAANDLERAPAGIDSWVRPLVVEWIEQSLVDESGRGLPESKTFRLRDGVVPLDGGGVALCLGPNTSESETIYLLLEAARRVLIAKGSRFVLVQQGRGGAAFARTLHLEHPDITTCVIDVPFDHPDATAWVEQEIVAAKSGYNEVRYDASGTRRKPRLAPLPLPDSESAFPVGPSDVVLITGGGKGIAAECALSLGRRTGAELILLGRSKPATDAELAINLSRFAAAGIRHRYLSVDVTDAEQVKKAMGEAGRITAFIHAAGSNAPQLISALDHAAFQRTLGPKTQGFRNVIAAIDSAELRLLVTFSSIIGRAGLAGEADYAVANEWLTRLTEDFQQAHPHCRCLALEWSVWSGVGMGQRLGRIESLRQQGITPITPEVGVEIFERLLMRSSPVAVVVTGRFGDLPTLKMDKPELPFRRFLEQPKVFYPGVELVVDWALSADADLYVEDHVLHGERLFPAVMGFEAMAQAAMALVNAKEPPSFSDVQLQRPVVVPKTGKTKIRVVALVRKSGEVEVALRTEETAFQIDHFRAVCRFVSGAALLRESGPKAAITIPSREPVAIDIDRDLYAELLFHTGRFRRVKNYRLIKAKECVAQLEPDPDAIWFGRHLSQERVLGDCGVRDAAIHAIQACIPHARLLPIGVDRIVIGKIPCLLERARAEKGIPELLLHARERFREGDTFCYDLKLLGEDGSLLEQWDGLRLRKVETLQRQKPWPDALLGPFLERSLEELIPKSNVSVALVRGDSEAALRHLLGKDLRVQRRSDGKPEVDRALNVSTAHAGNLTLAVAGSSGCDLETVAERPWREILGPERFALAQHLDEQIDIAGTRVWTALESLKKSGASDAPLVLREARSDDWVLFASAQRTIATYLINKSMVAAVLVE
ncbi:MAG TPA: SDR family NAD(P)-dependent oxidoreductase, partial [Verrucomicrobiae bacterium]|nr:SDR family NAD(P)-dependent oxidoreductase [Verrucomicrobiae bacterium]